MRPIKFEKKIKKNKDTYIKMHPGIEWAPNTALNSSLKNDIINFTLFKGWESTNQKPWGRIITPIIAELQLSIKSIPIILTVGSKDENRLDIKLKIHNLRFLSFEIYSKLKNWFSLKKKSLRIVIKKS